MRGAIQQADEIRLEREAQERRSPRAIALHRDLSAARDVATGERKAELERLCLALYSMVEGGREVSDENDLWARRTYLQAGGAQ